MLTLKALPKDLSCFVLAGFGGAVEVCRTSPPFVLVGFHARYFESFRRTSKIGAKTSLEKNSSLRYFPCDQIARARYLELPGILATKGLTQPAKTKMIKFRSVPTFRFGGLLLIKADPNQITLGLDEGGGRCGGVQIGVSGGVLDLCRL